VGFIDYARANSFEKDLFKLKFISTDAVTYPKLYEDDVGFTAVLPTPKLSEESISFLGYEFPNNVESQHRIAQLFRASVYHLSAHAFASNYGDYRDWAAVKNPQLSRFVSSLLEDMTVNSFIATYSPDKMADLGFACALALKRLRNLENVRIQATRVMALLTIYANIGLKRLTSQREAGLIYDTFKKMDEYRVAVRASIVDKKGIKAEKLEAAGCIYDAIMSHGPLIEFPSIPFTEDLGPCSLFPPAKVDPSAPIDGLLGECLVGMGVFQAGEPLKSGSKASRAEDLMIFESHVIEKGKERKILSQYDEFMPFSRFRSMAFPDQDYTGYLRAKANCRKEINRLTENLLNAMNSYMEDIRKMYGVLDLADVIQVIASKSDRTDVFLLEEKIQKSYAWAVLIDSSTSMRHIRDYVLEMAIILAESASKVLFDITSWGLFAFNDSFYVIKDFTEQYNTRVRSRLGGLKFEGLTYMPDAVEMAGRILRDRGEELKIIVVISDGWPYGYPNIYAAAKEAINRLEAGEVVVIGIGAQSGRMEFMFNSNCAAFTLKEFVNKFGDMYIETSLNVD